MIHALFLGVAIPCCFLGLHQGRIPGKARSQGASPLINVTAFPGRNKTHFHDSIMKLLEFQTQIPADGTLKLPPDIAAQILGDDNVRVVLVVGDSSENEDWKRLTAERFLAGYSPSDDIYDAL
jgi:hypothetical protein